MVPELVLNKLSTILSPLSSLILTSLYCKLELLRYSTLCGDCLSKEVILRPEVPPTDSCSCCCHLPQPRTPPCPVPPGQTQDLMLGTWTGCFGKAQERQWVLIREQQAQVAEEDHKDGRRHCPGLVAKEIHRTATDKEQNTKKAVSP